MSPRCEGMVPVRPGHLKPRRCFGRGVTRVNGVVVCRGHRRVADRPSFVRYKRWTVPERTEPERVSKLTRFPSQGPASADLYVMAVAR